MSHWVLPLAALLVALPCHAQLDQAELEAIEPEWTRLSLMANPAEEMPLGSGMYGQLELEPSLKGTFRLLPCLTLSLEYAVALGPQASPAPQADQGHRLFTVLDLEWGWGVLNFAVGYGFTGAERWIASVGLEFELG